MTDNYEDFGNGVTVEYKDWNWYVCLTLTADEARGLAEALGPRDIAAGSILKAAEWLESTK